MRRDTAARRRQAPRSAWSLVLAAGMLAAATAADAQQPAGTPDARVGLRAGWKDAGEAAGNLRLVSNTERPQGFVNPQNPGDFGFANSDLAFSGSYAFQGNFNGFQIWNIANPASPSLVTSVTCPGGQGDVSVWGNLLFMSVEEPRGRTDCGTQAPSGSVSPDRFRGVRIFDISNIAQPKLVGGVQTCRGSHTHTLVPAPDSSKVYVYVSGTSPVRAAEELPGCSGAAPTEDPNTSYFQIEVIEVPMAAPQTARVVNRPRIFADSTGNVAGLWAGGAQAEGAQRTARTDQCHDITVYPEIGLAAGACSGNGILLDISNPAEPRRIEEVFDPNFAYWHSATFSNAGDKLIYTDEWGGGTQARCRASDRPEWGANALFTLENRELQPVGYYKLPAAQTATENCVAHNGSLIPVPGRDIMVQAWYQGGVSVFDFTDPAKPVEIAFFDRGPVDAERLMLGGFWSAYWYNGHIYGSEIGRGLDVLALEPSAFLTANEIEAAKQARVQVNNPQLQTRITWPATFTVARAYYDQLVRGGGLPAATLENVARELDAAERLQGAARRQALTSLGNRLERAMPGAAASGKVEMLVGVVRELAAQG